MTCCQQDKCKTCAYNDEWYDVCSVCIEQDLYIDKDEVCNDDRKRAN